MSTTTITTNNSPKTGWDAATCERGEVSVYDNPVLGRRLMYRGPSRLLPVLSRLPSAYLDQAIGFLDLPFDYPTVLAVETLGQVERATPQYGKARVKLLSRLASAYPSPTEWDPRRPYEHQIDAFDYAIRCLQEDLLQLNETGSGFGLFLEQGMGKSRSAVDLCRYAYDLILDAYPARPVRTILVICKKIAAGQWEEAFKGGGWATNNVKRLSGGDDKKTSTVAQRQKILTAARNKAISDASPALYNKALIDSRTGLPYGHQPTVIIVNWQVVDAMDLGSQEWDIVIADEAHRIKDRNTKVAKQLKKMATRTRWRLALTGTPMGETPADLWSEFEFIDHRVFNCSHSAFVQRYCILGGFNGYTPIGFRPETVSELVTRSYSRAFRATKAAAFDMPEKTYETIRLKPSSAQATAYKSMAEKMYATTKDEAGNESRCSTENALTRTLRLEQITNGFMPVIVVPNTELFADAPTTVIPLHEVSMGDSIDLRKLAERASVTTNTAYSYLAEVGHIDISDSSMELLSRVFPGTSRPTEQTPHILVDPEKTLPEGYESDGCRVYISETQESLSGRQSNEGNLAGGNEVSALVGTRRLSSASDSSSGIDGYDEGVQVRDDITICSSEQESLIGQGARLYGQADEPTNRGLAPRWQVQFVDLDDSKLEWLLEYVAEKHEEDPTARIVVWRKFTYSLNKTYSALVDKFGQEAVEKINGSTKEHDRDSIRRRFNDRGSELFCLVLQEKAGCESISLDSADYLLYLCTIHSGINRSQSEDRGHRLGRTRPYYVIDIVYPNTVDMIGLRAARLKMDVAKVISTNGFSRALEADFVSAEDAITSVEDYL